MVVVKTNGVWRGTGRGNGMPDIEIVRGGSRWDIFEISHDNTRVLVASDLPFAAARNWGEVWVERPMYSRNTRVKKGQHQFGPISVLKTEAGWKVFSGDVEYGYGMLFWHAKRVAIIEERKHELAQFRLAMSFVPYPTKNINLHRRLTPYRWRKLSKETYAKAGGVCEICATAYPRLECHEDWEFDDFRGIQRLKRLMAICTLCHRSIHYNGWYRWPGDAILRVRDHFLAINGVDVDAMSAHIDVAEKVYKTRSDCTDEWFVDFGEYTTVLSTYPILYKGKPAYPPLPTIPVHKPF